MNSDQFRRLEELFEKLSELDAAERGERLARLESANEDATVLSELASMLRALDRQSRQGPSAAPLEPLMPRDPVDGEHIGPYRLVRRLGEGGMGLVFEAEQLEPIRRRVALKVVRWGLDSESVVGRFQSERQALAMMDHPNIARVFDAGTSEDGRPFFVMELVDGIPINDYCDENKLDIRARIELFATVCRAVQHAHRRGFIHRDLKPSNLLIGRAEDGSPVPKIIDFGIAKAIDTADVTRSLFTRLGEMVGTPEYMSPEQVEVGHGDIDTRSDVYSLGVVLYELLIGELPLSAETLRAGGFEEICRRIRETETPKPSSRVDTTSGGQIMAQHRSTDSGRLQRQLRDDLDWVVLQTLAKDREERYESASALAQDLERYLQGLPVLAGPPRWTYRARKLARRYRVPLAVAGSVAMALLLSTLIALSGLRQARASAAVAVTEATSANAVTDFLIELFESSTPGAPDAGTQTARELLDLGVERIQDDLETTPLVTARLLDTLGRIYSRLGFYDEAQPLLERGLRLREENLGAADPAVAASLLSLGYLEIDGLDRAERAAPLLERATRILATSGEDPQALVEGLAQLSYAYQRALRYDEAEEVVERASLLAVETYGEQSIEHATTLNRLGILRQEQRDWEGSVEPFEQSRRIVEEIYGSEHLDFAVLTTNLAYSLIQLGRAAPAVEMIQREIEISRAQLGNDHQSVADSLLLLANGQNVSADHAAAAESLGEAARIYATHLGRDHYSVTEVLYRQAETELYRGSPATSRRLFLEVLARLESSDHVRAPVAMVRTLEWLAHLQRNSGRVDEAQASCARALEVLESRLPERERTNCTLQLALITLGRGDTENANRMFAEAVSSFTNAWSIDRPADSMSRVAFWAASGQLDQAFSALTDGLERGFLHPWALLNPDLQPLFEDSRFDAYGRELRRRLELR